MRLTLRSVLVGARPSTNGLLAGRYRPTDLLAGRYQLQSRVGVGGMATIYHAWDVALERDVAVKVIHEHLADDAEIRERFRHEARHAAALVHPHIVNVYDQGIAPLPNDARRTPLPYMVMELIDGPSLREVLHQRGRLSPAEVLAVVLPVCDALARAHAAGVVHRDIKPENVLIGEGGVPKVADFGIAHAVTSTSHTTTGTLIGSVHYLAPELVRGCRASPASDQYAVGVLIFELLTGRKPLPAETPMAVVARHAREPIPLPSRFVQGIPPALDQVVARATALEVDERFADLSALAAELRSAVPKSSKRTDTLALLVPAKSIPASKQLGNRAARHMPKHAPQPPPGALVRIVGLILALMLGAVVYTLSGPVRAVPRLEGLTRGEATRALDQAELALVEDPSQPSRQVPEGRVLSQRPPPGSRLRRGETVTIVLSSGPAVVAMPRVVGLSEREGREALARHEFTVTPEEGYSDTVPRGVIYAQSPEAGTSVREGTATEVSIHVSKGKERVKVPDLSGLTRGEAEARLARAKLRGAFTEEYTSEASPGTVLSQSIGGGTTVDKGTTINVVVSRGPTTVSMPDVLGMPIDEATATLEARGFAVRVRTLLPTRIGPIVFGHLRMVVDQDPRPGRQVQRGSTVTLLTYTDS
jgi:beta-lactam-binding protein with PASTA domain